MGGAGHVLDHDIAHLEHALEIGRARGRYRLAQRILGPYHLNASRLTMIPFRPVARAIGTHHAVLGGDLVPQLRLGRAGRADAAHVDGKPIGVQRIELVMEATHSERRRPIGGEDRSRRQPGAARLANRVLQSKRKFGMHAADRDFWTLQRHGVTRACGLDQIGAGLHNLVWCSRAPCAGRLVGRRAIPVLLAPACRNRRRLGKGRRRRGEGRRRRGEGRRRRGEGSSIGNARALGRHDIRGRRRRDEGYGRRSIGNARTLGWGHIRC